MQEESPFREEKKTQTIQDFIKKKMENAQQLQLMRQIQEKQEEEMSEEIPEKIIWN